MPTEPTIFVVDDDAAVRDALSEIVTAMGINVECFPAADAFLRICDPSRPGCLVLDLRMPGMSGIELQERLVREGFLLPIIIITGHGDFASGIRAMKQGALDVIQKPFIPQQLEAAIEQAIESDAQRRQEQVHRNEIDARIAQLTPGERAVIQRLVAGKTTKAIAAEFHLSLRTIQSRHASLMKKMKVSSAAELIATVLPIIGPSQGAD